MKSFQVGALPKTVKPGYVLGALVGVQLLFTLWLIPPGLLFGNEPIAVNGYALHFSRAVTANELLSCCMRGWGYNPYFLAGYPAGTVFDVNNHFIELFVSGMHHLGIPLPVAFNFLMFGAILLAPVFAWLTARNFGLSNWQQIIVVAMAMMLWLADPQIRLTWRLGIIASGMAIYGLPFSLSCLYRYLEERTRYWYLLFLMSGSLVSLVHPLSFLFFYIPVALYFLIRFRHFDMRIWGALTLFAGVVFLVNSYWIFPLLQHLHLKTRSGYHWIGDLNALWREFLSIQYSGLRLTVNLLGIGGLVAWWRAGRKELVRFLTVLVLMLSVFGYLAGEIAVFRDLETYRNNLVASFLLIIPAGVFASHGISYFDKAQRRRRLILAGLLLALILPLIGASLLQFTPLLGQSAGQYTLQSLSQDEMAVVEWLRANADHNHRVMVEFWPLGALLPWYTGHEVIGGPFPLVWMPHDFANFTALKDFAADVPDGVRLFGRYLRETTPAQLQAYLQAYNVGWIVAYTDVSKEFLALVNGLSPAAGLSPYTIYRNTDAPTYFISGRGNVRADYSGIELSGASGGELILKYHWSSSLVTDPPQELLPYTVLDDPVPFIKIPENRFSEFVIRSEPIRR